MANNFHVRDFYKDSAKGLTQGLTTASSIWATAAVGVSVAYSMYIIAVAATAGVYFLLALHHFQWYMKLKNKWKIKESDQHRDDNNDL